MDFEELRIFLVLVEERTFLGAATRLSTSRSRVRRKLDQLERAAGAPLVRRESSGLVLTPAGEALARRGRALLEDAEHLISHVRDVGREPTGRLPIALPIAPTPVGWDEICRRALAAFPKLELAFEFTDRPSSFLPGRAEIALTFEEEIPHGCDVLEMGEFLMRLVVSPRYVKQHGVPETIAEISQHRLASWRRCDRPDDEIPLRNGRSVRAAISFSSNDPAQVYRMVAAGDCIGYLPAIPALDDPELKILFPEEIAGQIRERLVIPEIFADLPRVRRFVDLCAAQPQRIS